MEEKKRWKKKNTNENVRQYTFCIAFANILYVSVQKVLQKDTRPKRADEDYKYKQTFWGTIFTHGT